MGYKNRCYTQNFVRVNGCCGGGYCLCVYDWSVIGLHCVIHLGSKNCPHDSFFLKLQPMIHSLGFMVLSFWHALQLLQNIDSTNPFGNLPIRYHSIFIHFSYFCSKNMTNLESHSQIVLHLPYTLSILYHDRVAKHLNFSCELHLCNFHRSFSCMSLPSHFTWNFRFDAQFCPAQWHAIYCFYASFFVTTLVVLLLELYSLLITFW